jgi:hypothetical protein
MVAAVDVPQTLFRAPLTPGVHPGGQNIAYDLALVKLGPHTKFGEDWSNGVDFYTRHTNTHRFNFIYKISEGGGNTVIVLHPWAQCYKTFYVRNLRMFVVF